MSGRGFVGKGINPVLDAKQHICARRDKSNLESRFLNVLKGYGVFSTSWIEEGSFIVEYRGVLREAGQCIPDAYSYYFIYNNTRYCIDASVDDGSLGRLVNDDSSPNAKVKIISISHIPHLCLFALRDVQPGEEITYDYGGYDLPWRRGTWLCMGNPSQFDKNKECEEPPSDSDTTEQTTGQQEQGAVTEGTTPSQTVNKEREEDVPTRADKATQTTEERVCENQLLQIQLSPVTQQISSKEDARIHEESATSEQHVNEPVQLTSSNEEASESHLKNQMIDEAEQQILEQQQICMEVEACVEEQSCPVSAAQLACENEERNQPLPSDDSPAVNEQHAHEVEPISCNEEASESQTNRTTDEVGKMECDEEEQQQTGSMEVEACVEEHVSCPVSAAQSTCEEEQPTCHDEPCQLQLAEQTQVVEEAQQQQCNNDSSPTQNATESTEADQDSYLSNEDSNDETVSSDEEFIPDSETDSEDDSDIERPKKKPKTSVPPEQIKELPTPPVENHLVTQITKLNFCFVCGKACTKFARHLKLHRQDNLEIATAFKLRKNSKQRAHILEVLRNRGNYKHNKSVIANGTGLIKVRRMPKDDFDTQKFEHCMYCKGLYMRKELWKHVRRCTSNPERDIPKTSRSVLGLAALAECPHLKNISEDVKRMLCDMHQDEVAQTVRNDEYVLKLAQDFFDKNGNSKEKHAFVRQTIRCVGNFLILLRNKYAIRNLAEAIKPSKFSLVTKAVKEIAEFIEEKKCFAIPSLARRIGLALRKYCILSAQRADAVGDRILIHATSTFMDLFKNAQSQFAFGEKRRLGIQSKSFLMPFVNNVRIFHCYLEKAAQCAMKELRETPSAQSYADLCKVTLAQILMFNRRHGEVSQMTIKSIQKRGQVQAPEVSEALTELEKVFCEQYIKILVRQKIGALVPIILTPEMIDALMLLTEKREECSVPKSNIYVFGQPKSNRCYRGENALRICANECGATNPDELTSTKFSRHISTLSQVLRLKNQELKKLAKFIGHDISLRKEYYRQSEATPRLAKICTLILAIEKGCAAEMLGQSLDDIELPSEISERDSEDEYFEDDDAFLEDREERHERLLHLLPKTKAKTPNIACSVPAVTPKEEENKSTEQDRKSTTKEPKAEKPVADEQHKKKVLWTREEKTAIMKHFKKHIYYGRLASVMESRHCQLLEQPVLNGRTIQKIRDFVRNAGISFKKSKASGKGLTNMIVSPHQPAGPNSPSAQSIQSTNTSSASSEPSSQTANPTSPTVIPSPATDSIKPIDIFPLLLLPPFSITSSSNNFCTLLTANPTTHNVITPPQKPASSTDVPPQIAILKCPSVPSPQGADPDKLYLL